MQERQLGHKNSVSLTKDKNEELTSDDHLKDKSNASRLDRIAYVDKLISVNLFYSSTWPLGDLFNNLTMNVEIATKLKNAELTSDDHRKDKSNVSGLVSLYLDA